MQQVLRNIAIVCVIAVLWISGCTEDKNADQTDKNRTVAVETTEIARGDITAVISLTGDIEPWRQVNIAPDLPGKVAEIYVKEGDMVKQDQVLAKLDTRTAQLQQQQVEAGLAVAQANLNSTYKDWVRIQELHQNGTLSPQQYEKGQLAYESAKAQLLQAEAGLNMAQHQLDVSVMKAPFAGVITGKNINEGEYVNPGMSGIGPAGSSVVTLMDLSRVKIKTNISEKDMKRVHIGQEAHIAVDTYSEEVLFGKVSNINPTADPLTRSFAAEIAVANPQMKLRAGMFARVQIVTAQLRGVLVVPADALVAEQTGDIVFVIEGDKARKRPVQLGISQGPKVEVLAGLQEGDTVVTVGKEMLRDGATVTAGGGEPR